MRRLVRFHRCRHPRELGSGEAKAFLTHLALERQASSSTLAQALAAILFLYREVLGMPVAGLGDLPRARQPVRLPVVLTPGEVRRVLAGPEGTARLVGLPLYGSGLRLLEALTLRLKDVDLERRELRIRRAKGGRNRVTVVPALRCGPLAEQVERVRRLHAEDCAAGPSCGWVELPQALGRKYPAVGRTLPWQWLLPATRRYTHAETGPIRRHHLHESWMQRAMAAAVRRSGLTKRPYVVLADATIAEAEYNGAELIKLQRCLLRGVRAVIMRPHTHELSPPRGHGPAHLELLSHIHLRTTLALSDNEAVQVEVEGPPARSLSSAGRPPLKR